MVLDELHEAVEGKSGSSRRKAVDELVLRDGLEKVHHGLGECSYAWHIQIQQLLQEAAL